MKEMIEKNLKKALKELDIKLREEEIEKFIEIPKSYELGDYSFPCFFLSEKLKQEPKEIALNLRKAIGTPPSYFEDVQTSGAYVNFFINKKMFAKNLIQEILRKKEDFGKIGFGKGKTIVVEFSSPNIAKPFGVGHLRSTIIGNSIANICEFEGFNVKRIDYLGDWGTQFGRLILGYSKFGDQAKLEKTPIKHLYEVYIKANKKEYEEESRKYFQQLESKEEKIFTLWKAFRELSLKEFKKIYKLFGIKFDVYEGEAEQTRKASDVIKKLKQKGILKKSRGALIVNLKKYGLGIVLIQKSDGTTLYATRDLAAAIKRYNRYKFKKMIYEVGQEQKLYFKQLFKILELMGYEWAKNCIHVEHGLYLGKNKKKFSTRKGDIIFFEDIFKKTLSLAKREIKERFPKIPEKELEKRAIKISLAAIFYGDLKNKRTNNIVFDIKRFVSFEGNTGPYLLYSYARASSISKKINPENKKFRFNIDKLEPQEIELVKKLSQFPEVVLSAYISLNPATIANYSYQLSQIFNEFYHACPVIGSKEEVFRIALVEAFRQVLKNSLALLGIKTIEEM